MSWGGSSRRVEQKTSSQPLDNDDRTRNRVYVKTRKILRSAVQVHDAVDADADSSLLDEQCDDGE